MTQNLELTFVSGDAAKTEIVALADLIIGGWTGRDKAKLEEHIVELEAIGVARPVSTPCFYRVGANLLSTDDNIQVIGTASSGEAEFFLLKREGGFWIGLGSDHTDREVEAYNVTVSKQCCPKPIASTLWRHEDVADHWDQLILRSFRVEAGKKTLYQEGSVTAMIDPIDLAAQYAAEVAPLTVGQAMFGGTLPVIGALTGAARFEIELEDPVLDRKISHGYDVSSLPNIG
jgi:hypothetical protein